MAERVAELARKGRRGEAEQQQVGVRQQHELAESGAVEDGGAGRVATQRLSQRLLVANVGCKGRAQSRRAGRLDGRLVGSRLNLRRLRGRRQWSSSEPPHETAKRRQGVGARSVAPRKRAPCRCAICRRRRCRRSLSAVRHRLCIRAAGLFSCFGKARRVPGKDSGPRSARACAGGARACAHGRWGRRGEKEAALHAGEQLAHLRVRGARRAKCARAQREHGGDERARREEEEQHRRDGRDQLHVEPVGVDKLVDRAEAAQQLRLKLLHLREQARRRGGERASRRLMAAGSGRSKWGTVKLHAHAWVCARCSCGAFFSQTREHGLRPRTAARPVQAAPGSAGCGPSFQSGGRGRHRYAARPRTRGPARRARHDGPSAPSWPPRPSRRYSRRHPPRHRRCRRCDRSGSPCYSRPRRRRSRRPPLGRRRGAARRAQSRAALSRARPRRRRARSGR
eukprot:5984162-Pleurochrysis_carterae.AAC.2